MQPELAQAAMSGEASSRPDMGEGDHPTCREGNCTESWGHPQRRRRKSLDDAGAKPRKRNKDIAISLFSEIAQ